MKPVWLTRLGLYVVNRRNEISAMTTTIFQGGKTKQIEPSPSSLSLSLSLFMSLCLSLISNGSVIGLRGFHNSVFQLDSFGELQTVIWALGSSPGQ